MKTIVKSFVLNSLIASAILVSSSCSKDSGESDKQQYASILQVATDGTTSVIEANLESALVLTTELSAAEIEMLVKMKDEEKLARDVYRTLYTQWGNTIFSNIAMAEDKHLNAVITLLATYGISDTIKDDTGVFESGDVTNLYANLVSVGSKTIEDAFKTGALIEEMDIKDLTVSLENTANENITLVFENLLKGSRNHLRAFNRQLAVLGVSYVSQFIDQVTYNEIANSAMEQGKMYKMNKGTNGKGNHNGNGNGKKGGNQGSGDGTCNL